MSDEYDDYEIPYERLHNHFKANSILWQALNVEDPEEVMG